MNEVINYEIEFNNIKVLQAIHLIVVNAKELKNLIKQSYSILTPQIFFIRQTHVYF